VQDVEQASFGHVFRDEQLFLLAVMVSERRQDVRVSESPKASHLGVEDVSAHFIHLSHPFYHHRQPTSHGGFVRRAQPTVSENLRRSLHQIGQAKCAPLIVNHHEVANTPRRPFLRRARRLLLAAPFGGSPAVVAAWHVHLHHLLRAIPAHHAEVIVALTLGSHHDKSPSENSGDENENDYLQSPT